MRRLGCFAAILPSLCFSVACLPVAQDLRPPTPTAAAVTQLLLDADSARQVAFSTADPAPLRPLFADSAMAPLLPLLTGLRLHQARVEERDDSRRVVHWTASPGSAAGVLQAAGEERVDYPVQPAAPWTRIVRQWYASLHWTGARWLVVDAGDLPPGQWWKSG